MTSQFRRLGAILFSGAGIFSALAEETKPRDPPIVVATDHSALVLCANPDGTLAQLSFGAKPAELSALARTFTRFNEALPCYGNGYPLEPALQIVHADGNTSTDLAYVDREQSGANGNVQTTRIKLRDRHYPFFVTLCFRAYRSEDVIEQWTEISHDESSPVTLGRFA